MLAHTAGWSCSAAWQRGGRAPQPRPQQRRVPPLPPAAAGGETSEPSGSSKQQQQQGDFDIISGTPLQQAQGPSCDWPRMEVQRRWQEAALVTTGFPLPSGYGSPASIPQQGSGLLWQLRNPPRDAPLAPARTRPGTGGAGQPTGGSSSSDLVPVFRAAPYSAEAARLRRPSPTARVLFLDDGCGCRAVLAQALMHAMLRKLPAPGLDVEVQAASIGPPVPGGHDERVVQVARDMDIPLQPRRAWEFDEMRDTVEYDLIVVMDGYDRQEVVREVAVLERLRPGGGYLTRVQRLNSFARAGHLVLKDRCLLVPEDVPDPLYGVVSAAVEQAALRRAVHSIALGCRGLLAYLLKLRAKCGTGPAAVPLRVALAQSLQCPLMDPTSHHAISALIHCQLAPAELALWQQQQRQHAQEQAQAQALGKGASAGAGRRAGAATTAAACAPPAGWAAHITGWPRPTWVEPGSSIDEGDEAGGSSSSNGGSGRLRPLWTVQEVGGQPVVMRWPRPEDPSNQRGYWTDIRNVQRELSKWMERQGVEGRLPTQQELRRSGANTLSSRIDSHGGLAVFAERMGLPLSGRAPNGTWDDFEHLARELRSYMEQQQQQDVRQPPAVEQLQQLAAGSSSKADGASGGGESQAQIPAPPASHRNLRYASGSWVGRGSGLHQPGPASGAALLSSGQGAPKAAGAAKGGSSGAGLVFLPTQQELRAAGRADLIGGIRQHGGSLAVARRLGWAVRHGRLPSEAAVVQQLFEFAARAQQGAGKSAAAADVPSMPTLRELSEGGRADLAGAVMRLGGVQAFAALLQAEHQRRQQAQQREERSQQQGAEGEAQGDEQAPQRRLVLHQEGESHILSYSGSSGSSIPRRPHPEPAQPPQPAVVRVGEAVMQLIEARGWEARIPTKQELLAAGRRDLHAAITRCGGTQKVADHLQLPYTETRGRRRGGGAGSAEGQLAGDGGKRQAASRLRQPPSVLASQAVEAARAQLPVAQRPQGPVSRLLEKELVLEAYEDTTFV